MASALEVKGTGKVRAQMRQVVGDLENVLGELKTVVGDLRVLVTQIDAVTEKIDRKYTDEDVKGHSSAAVTNDKSHSLRHSVSHSCNIGRRKSSYIDNGKRSPGAVKSGNHLQISKSTQSSSAQYLNTYGMRSPDPQLSRNKQSSSAQHLTNGKLSPDSAISAHSPDNQSSSSGKRSPVSCSSGNNKLSFRENKVETINNMNSCSFDVEKYQLSTIEKPRNNENEGEKGSSSSNSSGYATRVVGKRRKIGPKLALSIPGSDNSKLDSSSLCSSFTDQDSHSVDAHRKHLQCSPCSPVPSVDYCGIYERELDLKLELDFEYDELLEVYSSVGSTHQGELQLFSVPLAPPYDHDINTWTQYTVDFTNSNNCGFSSEKDDYSDSTSDVLSSDDTNMRFIPKALNPKFVNYSWRTVIKP